MRRPVLDRVRGRCYRRVRRPDRAGRPRPPRAGRRLPAVLRQPCLFPFPDNRFTAARPHSATGAARPTCRRAAMPINIKGVRIAVGPYDRNDGFSPGSAIVLHVPGLDTAAALNADRRGPAHEHRAVAGQAPADRADRPGDRPAPADLGRA